MMYGQMTAGSWIYIGTQGILQGTYETFGAVARRHFDGSLRGRVVLTGGLRGVGGAPPPAAPKHDALFPRVEIGPAPGPRRPHTPHPRPPPAPLHQAPRLCGQA